VLKFQHIGEHLLVHTARRDERGQPGPREIHIVSPVDLDVGMPDSPGLVSLTSPIYCNFLVVPVTGAGKVTVTVVLPEPNEYIRFRQSLRDGKIETEGLEMNHSFREFLSKMLAPQVQRLREDAKRARS
jgi:hypothetical protein